jgi:Protein kinase domain
MYSHSTAALLIASLPVAAQSWPTFYSAYEDGLAAQTRGDHAMAVRAFARAASLNSSPGRRVRTYGMNFLPTYYPYLRLAESAIAVGDLESAETALKQSASLGVEPQEERAALSGKVRVIKEARNRVASEPGESPNLNRASDKEPAKLSAPPSNAPVQSGGVPHPVPNLSQPSTDLVKPLSIPLAEVPVTKSSRNDANPLGKPVPSEPPSVVSATALKTPSPDAPVPVVADSNRMPGTRARWIWLSGSGVMLALAGAFALRRKRKVAAVPTTLVLGSGSQTLGVPFSDPDARNIEIARDPNLGRIYGPYLPIEVLGQGGCATTYFGHHPETGEEVAIKVPHRHLLQDSDFKARFHREASLGALLHHPRIVPILDPGPTEGDPWLAMPFIRGLTLDQYLAKKGPLEVSEAIGIACDISEAIGFAHSKGIVHRDLKPANVMMTGAGAIVMDFGIARVLDGAMTVSTMFLGTPLYSAPECVLTPRVGPPADRYALGIMLFEFLAGEPPFNGESPFQILEAQRSQPLPDLPAHCGTVPPRLLRLIQRLCAKSPEERPEDGETSIILNELRLEHPRVPPVIE